jgi:NAD-dependent protein deacetylase/lipoamidase
VTDRAPVPALDLSRGRLLVLTGAGISAESGLGTFRGAGGLWEDEPVEAVASPEGFARDPGRVWRFYAARRAAAADARPNRAHLALAACEERLGDRFLLTTQNVDGLHARAGSRRVHELHGSLWRTRCADCDRPPFVDHATPADVPRCSQCGGRLRPDIVWFGEPVDLEADWATKRFIKEAAAADEPLTFLAIGTSGTVSPASQLVRYATDFGAVTWLANLEPAANGGAFAHHVTGPATAVVPALLGIS